MSIVKEFRDFAMRGNVLDLAIGVVIGAAFGKIVTSLVSDVLMPVLGLILGKLDFSTLSITIARAFGVARQIATRRCIRLGESFVKAERDGCA